MGQAAAGRQGRDPGGAGGRQAQEARHLGRGFLGGAVWGVGIAVLGLVGLSQLGGAPEPAGRGPSPETPPPLAAAAPDPAPDAASPTAADPPALVAAEPDAGAEAADAAAAAGATEMAADPGAGRPADVATPSAGAPAEAMAAAAPPAGPAEGAAEAPAVTAPPAAAETVAAAPAAAVAPPPPAATAAEALDVAVDVAVAVADAPHATQPAGAAGEAPMVVAEAPAAAVPPVHAGSAAVVPATAGAPAAAAAPVFPAPAAAEPAAPATSPLTSPAPAAVAEAPAAPAAPAILAELPDPAEARPVARAMPSPAPVSLADADAAPTPADLPPPPPLTAEEQAILDGAPPPAAPAAETTEEAQAAPLLPVAPLDKAVPGVTTDRLPRIAEPAPAPEIVPEPLPQTAEAAPSPAMPGTRPAPITDNALAAEAGGEPPPIERFARTFDNPQDKPRFAVVLVDTGDPALDRRALAELPFPVTFALDPTAPESALAATIYREAGQEVVMLATGIPDGATAADLEVTFGVLAEALPEAVAVLDPEAGGFQGNRVLATLVMPVVAGQGRGMLSWDRGLNAADQIARREGLRAATIFRRLDGEGENEETIRRYLDRAAFKAAQDGTVVVAGETRAETVAALLAWAVEGRAATVALAPLTAVLVAE